MPSSRRSSQLRDQTHVSTSPALASGLFSAGITWEAPQVSYQDLKDANEGVGEQTELGMIKLHFKQLCTSRFQPDESSYWYFGGFHRRRKWQPTPVFLPGESQGQGSLVGCHLWGGTESDTTEVTQQQQQLVAQ